jgi:hypothetical protein
VFARESSTVVWWKLYAGGIRCGRYASLEEVHRPHLQGDPKKLTSEGPARHSPRRRSKTLVTPLGHTTQGTVLARCITGSRSGSPPPHVGMKKRQNLVNHVMACRAQGPGFGDRRPAGPVNTACVIHIEDVRRIWEERVGGGVLFEVPGGEV